ncbi:MAG: hypothetical protein WKF75_06975 [Singulisphaera sp.]
MQARGITKPGQKLRLLGRVADRWLDLGETGRAGALLSEGRALAKEVPRRAMRSRVSPSRWPAWTSRPP